MGDPCPADMPEPGQLRVILDLAPANKLVEAQRQSHEARDAWHAVVINPFDPAPAVTGGAVSVLCARFRR